MTTAHLPPFPAEIEISCQTEPGLDSYELGYGTRAATEPEEVGKRGRLRLLRQVLGLK